MPVKLLLLTFTIKQLDTMTMPSDSGSMLRGAFGHALKSLSSYTTHETATHCSNAYHAIFERAPIASKPNQNNLANNLSMHSSINPYVIKVPKIASPRVASNQLWSFTQLLIGEQAIAQADVVIKAWEMALRNGIGGTYKRHRAMLQAVRVGDTLIYQHGQLHSELLNKASGIPKMQDTMVYNCLRARNRQDGDSDDVGNAIQNKYNNKDEDTQANDIKTTLTLNFKTPFRIQQQGKVAHTDKHLDIKRVFYALYNRIKQCQQLDSQATVNHKELLGFDDFYHYKRAIDKLELSASLTPYRVTRHSNRQGKSITLFALTGCITVQASKSLLLKLLPILHIGQYLHVGKNTTLGLGEYELQI